MSVVVPIIVVIIILAQIYFFRKNIERMNEYKGIFEKKASWGIKHDLETGFVSGIRGDGTVFLSLLKVLLTNNSGTTQDR